jgi:hypothetical protein
VDPSQLSHCLSFNLLVFSLSLSLSLSRFLSPPGIAGIAVDKAFSYIIAYGGGGVEVFDQGVDGTVHEFTTFTLPGKLKVAYFESASLNAFSGSSVYSGGDSGGASVAFQLLIVGDNFNNAVNAHRSDSVQGALSEWDPVSSQWLWMSTRPLVGRVDVLLSDSDSSLLYVAGRRSLGDEASSLLSRFSCFDSTSWRTPVGAAANDYASNGVVYAMSVSSRGDLSVAGDFFLCDAEVSLVRWDGSNFHIIEVNGRVQTLTSHDFSIYIGGGFGLALYQDSAEIKPLLLGSSGDGGVVIDDSVTSLTFVDSCLFLVGVLSIANTKPQLNSSSSSSSSREVRYFPSDDGSSFDAMAFADDSRSSMHNYRQRIFVYGLPDERLP